MQKRTAPPDTWRENPLSSAYTTPIRRSLGLISFKKIEIGVKVTACRRNKCNRVFYIHRLIFHPWNHRNSREFFRILQPLWHRQGSGCLNTAPEADQYFSSLIKSEVILAVFFSFTLVVKKDQFNRKISPKLFYFYSAKAVFDIRTRVLIHLVNQYPEGCRYLIVLQIIQALFYPLFTLVV